MTGVVLRCPNCGTIKPAEGQCEACHEESVRYFCLNHAPGVWLESVACPQCGARFGDPAPTREEPSSEVLPEPSPSTVRMPPYRPPDRDAERGPWDAGVRSEPGGGGGHPAGLDPLRILFGALTAAARARSARAERPSYDEVAPMRRGGGGCISRIFMLILFLIALFLMVPIFLGALLGF